MNPLLQKKLTILRSKFGHLKSTYHIKKIGFFGSLVRDDFNKKSSDIDLMVEFSEPISLFKFFELERLLSDILGFKVDLVSKKAIKSTIKKSVINEVIYV